MSRPYQKTLQKTTMKVYGSLLHALIMRTRDLWLKEECWEWRSRAPGYSPNFYKHLFKFRWLLFLTTRVLLGCQALVTTTKHTIICSISKHCREVSDLMVSLAWKSKVQEEVPTAHLVSICICVSCSTQPMEHKHPRQRQEVLVRLALQFQPWSLTKFRQSSRASCRWKKHLWSKLKPMNSMLSKNQCMSTTSPLLE